MAARASSTTATRPFHRGLTRDTVVAAALDLIDREGLDALTMRKLATDLDVEAASLYTHVRNKDELVDAVLDHVLDQVPLPDLDQPWRDALVDGYRGYRTALLAHPAMVALITQRGRMSMAQLRLVERSIELLQRGGLSIERAVAMHVTLVAHTIGFVVQEVGRSPDLPAEVLASSETLQRTMRALFATTPDERFDAGLEVILAGLGTAAGDTVPRRGRGRRR